MSLRGQALTERTFATLVILGLGAFLGGGLAFSLRQERASAVPTRPRLLAVLEGVMAPNVSQAEVATFRTWVQGGATREGFGPVEAVVANNCASCHGPGGQFPRLVGFEDLHPLAIQAAPEGFYAAVGSRALHLVCFPLAFLVAAGGYLRRSAWAGRRALLGGSLLAVGFDAAQWWLRQGRPEALWASWTALGLQSTAFLLLAVVVLKELWTRPSGE
jgi:hypothetical protein